MIVRLVTENVGADAYDIRRIQRFEFVVIH